MPDLPPVITVIGPTASGKSGLSLRLAHALGGEVVNADSMQLYAGMDIGTAKLLPEQREGVPHHVLDIWPVSERASVAEYQRLARVAVADIHARGLVPIIVGGSGLYVRAVIDDLQFPGADLAARADLEQELAEVGAAAMHARLATLDPAAASAILPSNGRRIVRALEVLLSGRAFQATLPTPRPVFRSLTIGLRVPRPVLDQRIAVRVDQMWRDGFVDEVHALVGAGLRDGVTARAALGYAQILQAWDEDRDSDTAREPTVTATRRFARRQWSWFERDRQVCWLDWDDPDLAVHICRMWSDGQFEPSV